MQHWYCLYSKPHAERVANDALARKGIETYLPMIIRRRRRRGELRQVSEPLFPCYLFAQADLDIVGISALRWTTGLRDVVHFNGSPAPVPAELVGRLRERLADGGQLQRDIDYARFKPGARVHVLDGPLSELDAIFERALPGHARAQILLRILGRWTRTEIDLDQLAS